MICPSCGGSGSKSDGSGHCRKCEGKGYLDMMIIEKPAEKFCLHFDQKRCSIHGVDCDGKDTKAGCYIDEQIISADQLRKYISNYTIQKPAEKDMCDEQVTLFSESEDEPCLGCKGADWCRQESKIRR